MSTIREKNLNRTLSAICGELHLNNTKKSMKKQNKDPYLNQFL